MCWLPANGIRGNRVHTKGVFEKVCVTIKKKLTTYNNKKCQLECILKSFAQKKIEKKPYDEIIINLFRQHPKRITNKLKKVRGQIETK